MHSLTRPEFNPELSDLLPSPLNSGENRLETLPVVNFWLGSWRLSLDRQALSSSDLRKSYQDIAGRWAGIVRRLGYTDAYKACFRRAQVSSSFEGRSDPVDVLDCGIGAGDLSLALASTAAFPMHVTGVDIAPNMLQTAGNRLSNIGIANTMVEADAHHLPFPDRSFDLVICAHLLEHFTDPAQLLSEFNRVLKPGGTLILCLTRRSLHGFWVHLKWRAQILRSTEVFQLLAGSGFNSVKKLEKPRRGVFQRMSDAYQANKS